MLVPLLISSFRQSFKLNAGSFSVRGVHSRPRAMHDGLERKRTESRDSVVKRFCFLYGRSGTQITIQRPAILTEIFPLFASVSHEMP